MKITILSQYQLNLSTFKQYNKGIRQLQVQSNNEKASSIIKKKYKPYYIIFIQYNKKMLIENKKDENLFPNVFNSDSPFTQNAQLFSIFQKYRQTINKKRRQSLEIDQISSQKQSSQKQQSQKQQQQEEEESSQDQKQLQQQISMYIDACQKLLKNYYNQDYLQITRKKIIKQDDIQTYSVKAKKLQFYIQPQIYTENLGQDLYSKYLLRYVKKQNKIYIANQRKKIDQITLKGQYSQSLALNIYTGRYYLYDNTSNQIVIRSIKTTEQLCRFKTQVKKIDPILYLQYQPQLLILAGGYTLIGKYQVMGSDKIQIFKVGKWIIQTPKIFKLQYGRIAPILFEMKIQKDLLCLVILGGNRYAYRKGNELDYSKFQTQNLSLNSKAPILTKDDINLAFSQTNTQYKVSKNINIRSDSTLKLYNCLIFKMQSIFRNSLDLLLKMPDKQNIFKLNYVQNIGLLDIHETKKMTSQKNVGHFNSGVRIQNNNEQSVLFIDENGQLVECEIYESVNKKACNIY